MNRPILQAPATATLMVPAVLFVVSLAGLIWALLVDGRQDAVATLAVAAPLAAIVWAMVYRRRR